MSTLFTQPAVALQACTLSAPPTQQQADAVAEMLAASDPWATLQVPASALAAYLMREDPALRRYVISVNGEVAGIICVRHPWLRGPYVELLGLSPNLRGKGIGRQVMSWAESEARRQAKNLWVVASAFNHRALAFYESLGFQRIGALPDLVSPGQDEILLRKPLD